MKKSFIICGPPGSGKGTLSKQIAEKHNLHHISTGDLLRDRAQKNDDTGKLIASLINNGHYVSDELIYAIITEEIKNHPNYILDGFPRTTQQLHMLKKFFENYSDDKKPSVIILQAGIKIVTERIRQRSLQENRLDDKVEDVLKVRMTEYIKKTQPIINHYAKFTSSIILDASKTKEEVFNEFENKLS